MIYYSMRNRKPGRGLDGVLEKLARYDGRKRASHTAVEILTMKEAKCTLK